jgi:NAD(P)-dependent dehydrogenase (short-subunit alcohol dehydrogenase family)
MRIEDTVAIVTGAGAQGTGRAIALSLAREGAAVIASDLDGGGAEETAERIRADGGAGAALRADMRLDDDIEALIGSATRIHGRLDILVNNAGWTDEPHFPDGSVVHWGATLDLNLRGPMLATQLAARAMRDGGAIVNVSSVAGLGYGPHDSPEYAAAKAGLIRFTAALAPLAERLGVRVNCVVPHWIATEHVLRTIAGMTPEERARVPERLNDPGEIADVVLRFVRDDSLAGRVIVCPCGAAPRLIEPVPWDRITW